MMNVPKVLNITLGALTGLAIVVAINNVMAPKKQPPTSHCSNIYNGNELVGSACTYDSGPLLERFELTPEACFKEVAPRRGNDYAFRVCYPEGYLLEKRAL